MCANYNRKDRFYEKAKSEGYLSRAAYKLLELDKKYGLLKTSFKVLDLGCWPGSWMQVASEKVKDKGIVVGIDLVKVEHSFNSNVTFIQGDVTDEEVLNNALEKLHITSLSIVSPSANSTSTLKFDIVISDMSPKLTGIPEADSAQTVHCAELALNASKRTLKHGGNLIIKLFKSQDSEDFIKQARPNFDKIQRASLESTRTTSNEFYFVGLGYKNIKL